MVFSKFDSKLTLDSWNFFFFSEMKFDAMKNVPVTHNLSFLDPDGNPIL